MVRLQLDRLDERDLMSAGVMGVMGPSPQEPGAVLGFTPPIGSNKGSIVDGTQTNGIIAILIGLREPSQPVGGMQVPRYIEQDNMYKQG